MLPLGLTEEALAAATAEPDPESLAASVRLRERFGPELAAAAVTQVVLRKRAEAKFGSSAADLFFTRDGLEQASRPEVAGHHAARMVAAGVRRVVDLGCGIGTDALAFARAGLEVVAVDADPEVAGVARANLGAAGFSGFRVLLGAAEEVWPTLAARDTGVFCDPARRTTRGRSWRLEDLSPDWPFVTGLLGGDRPAGVKLGPGLPHAVIGEDVEAEWLSSNGTTVEAGLWAGPGAEAGRWSALVLSAVPQRLVTAASGPPTVDRVRRYLYEPLGAVIRSRGVATLARQLDAALVHSELAYLTADRLVDTPYATGFAIEDSFAYRERELRRWTADHDIGVLEIKTRGLGLDPAHLRRRLRLRGRDSATVVITRTVDGPTVLVVRREPTA